MQQLSSCDFLWKFSSLTLLSIIEHVSHIIDAGAGDGADAGVDALIGVAVAAAFEFSAGTGVDVFCWAKNCVIRGVVAAAAAFDLSRRVVDLLDRGVERATTAVAVVSTADAATIFELNEFELARARLGVSLRFGVVLCI